MTKQPSKEALVEIFGTPKASRAAIHRWKTSWRHERPHIEINSFVHTIRIINDFDIDPLFYQFYTRTGVVNKFYVIFYKDEDLVLFKINYQE